MMAGMTHLHNGVTQLYERLKLRHNFRNGIRNKACLVGNLRVHFIMIRLKPHKESPM